MITMGHMQNKKLPPIILGSSINVMDQSVALKDPSERIKYTIESIENWLKIAPDIQLVVCDGSGFDFTPLIAKQFSEKFHAHQIECLHFLNNSEKVAKFGKGYGEGEIIQYAITNSLILKDHEWFAKCTGKLWVDNFMECISEWNGRFLCQAYFSQVFSLKKTRLEYVDTRFYLATKEFYNTHLATLHLQVGGHFESSIEDNFKKVIFDFQLTGILFRCFPIIRGVGGASGKYYKGKFWRRNKDRLRLKLVQVNPEFAKLFNQP